MRAWPRAPASQARFGETVKARHVFLYDTTLRDGAQGEGVTFSSDDKLQLAGRIARLGVRYIEGGFPHPANPKEEEFFRRARGLDLGGARLTAFGSTRKAGGAAHRDPGLKALVHAGTRTVAIFGKSWDLHVREILRASLGENLNMIRESVRFLKRAGREVVYDAEHLFDGYRRNPGYALASLLAAQEAGADWLVLCDTNGGCLPEEVSAIIRAVKPRLRAPFGIHAHNDGECAVANSLAAVSLGATQVQGTVNGFGERCGNANLCSVIPNLQLKLGIRCVPDSALRRLRSVSWFVSEVAIRPPRDEMPYVGASAFAHKGGVHIHAVKRNPAAYEHESPASVGNWRRILISDQSGAATILWKGQDLGLKLKANDTRSRNILAELKRLEQEGYHFEGAEASFELLIDRITGKHHRPFDLKEFRVAVNRRPDGTSVSEATLKLDVGGREEHSVAEGDGPVNALDRALRKALTRFYPELKTMHLADYKVRVIDPQASTAAKVRVLIESRDGKDSWSTVGVSENIIEASWQALSDSVIYKLKSHRGKR